jgi:hypothetical protein
LSDYTGFSSALYEPDVADPTGVNLGRLLSLSPTELPDKPGEMALQKVERRTLKTATRSRLLTVIVAFTTSCWTCGKGNSDQGRSYILVINPPATRSMPSVAFA